MTPILITIVCLLVAATHILSAIKSGCFYAASSGTKPPLLKRFMDNLHYVQTPFWYALFGAMLVSMFAILMHSDGNLWMVALRSYLLTQGTSTMAGPLYQGFINVGGGKKFTDETEKRAFEFAVPVLNKSVWIPKFWYGKRRWFLVPFGILFIVLGLVL